MGFSCGSFCRGSGSERQRLLWSILVPLKVKCFVWQMLLDRVAVKDRLHQLGLIQKVGNVCSLCDEDKKKSQYLFQRCNRVYTLWFSVAKVLNIRFVGARDIGTCLNYWFNLHVRAQKLKIWHMAFAALIWSIWRAKNQAIFHQETFSEDWYFEMFCFNLSWWVKSEWGEHVLMVAEIAWCLGLIVEALHLRVRRGGCGHPRTRGPLRSM